MPRASRARYKIDTHRNGVVVFEPNREESTRSPSNPAQAHAISSAWQSRVRYYSPVLQFVLVHERRHKFLAERMSYRGSMGRWLSLHDAGSVAELADVSLARRSSEARGSVRGMHLTTSRVTGGTAQGEGARPERLACGRVGATGSRSDRWDTWRSV